MAGKPAGAAWKRHELVSKAIFEALLSQSNAENLEVRHNVCLKGLKTRHQIDVFWKFRMGGIDHTVIAQVKKKRERAKKSDLLLFHSILLDIPGQPRGVFVSEHGYQKGAPEVAVSAGITPFIIRELEKTPPEPIRITHLSVVILTQRPDIVALEFVILQPSVKHVQIALDELWVAQHPEAQPGNWRTTATVNIAQFLDAVGNKRTSMQTLVQDRIREFWQEGQTGLSVELSVEFPDPTYMSGIKILNSQHVAMIAFNRALK